MTATDLGGGGPDKFLGAFVKNISSNLGLSTSPSTASVTVVEDTGAQFEFPDVGTYHEVAAGSTWKFGGVLTRYEIDIANISGRTIRINLSDPREIMKSIPVIIAPGYDSIVQKINTTGCSVLDIFGAFTNTGINLSGWNQAGMPFERIVSALNGENILFGNTVVPVEQQIVKAFGERYVFNIDELTPRVDGQYRINTNLTPLSNIIDDLSNRNSFDWFVESQRRSDNIIEVTVKIIDRSVDNIDISLQGFLDQHENQVITATSGVELRNELSCLALQGASVENMTKVSILGLANEPVDLTVEGGINNYKMDEEEMRAVLQGRTAWEIWLGLQRDFTTVSYTFKGPKKDGDTGAVIPGSTSTTTRKAKVSRGGFSRYGSNFTDAFVNEMAALSKLAEQVGQQIPFKPQRVTYIAKAGDSQREIVGKVFSKLESHAKATYGKRFVHNDIGDEVIQSVWTRDAVALGDTNTFQTNADPNSYFRQEDGRTRAYVEFSIEQAGGAFSLGLNNLTNLFGDQNIFNKITRFGTTFSNRSSRDDAIVVLDLVNNFDPQGALIDIKDVSNYVYKEAQSPFATVKTSLYVSCTVNKDGVVVLPGGIFESTPSSNEMLRAAIISANKENDKGEEDVQAKLLRFFGNTNSLWGMHGRAFQPDFVFVPTRSRTLRYGPVFSEELGASAQGKLQIIQDDGFSPWEFGSISLMINAMQLKVNNATSLQKEAFSANIQVEGFPQFNIGDSLEKNSNINSITMSFGDGGVKTSYSLQTYTRKFGEISKEDWARLAFILSNGGGRVLPQQQASFLTQYNVNVDKNFSGPFFSSDSSLNGGALDFG
jgi:hypothetical protein